MEDEAPAPEGGRAAGQQRAPPSICSAPRGCGALQVLQPPAMLRVPPRELSAQLQRGIKPRLRQWVLTSLPEARLNSAKMCATMSHAE